MNDDEDDDMIFNFAFTAVAIFTVLFVVGSVGAIIWSWL
jgi:nitrate reductase NapE component